VLIGRRYRRGALFAGIGAAVIMGVLGACTTVTGGSGKVDAADAPAYRTSMSSSVAESAASSSVRESERQQSLTTEAIHTACETLSTSSADAVDSVNAYVDAVNGKGDPVATGGPAVDALNHSADLVTADINDAVPQDIRDALSAWSDSARGAAAAVSGHVPPDQFNAAVDRLNESRSRALDLCDATY
jgi:hypothetical protein